MTTALIGAIVAAYIAAGFLGRDMTQRTRFTLLTVTLIASLAMYVSWHFIDS